MGKTPTSSKKNETANTDSVVKPPATAAKIDVGRMPLAAEKEAMVVQ